MERMLKRLLIINDEPNFVRLVAGTAERLGFATRILRHTLDLEYVMQHWHPDCVAVQMAMPEQQDIEVLEFLERAGFSGCILLAGAVPEESLKEAAEVARDHDLKVTCVLCPSIWTDAPQPMVDALRCSMACDIDTGVVGDDLHGIPPSAIG